jgi:hypothetical protein
VDFADVGLMWFIGAAFLVWSLRLKPSVLSHATNQIIGAQVNLRLRF